MTTDTTDLLGHFAWCAQIALGIARRNKTITTGSGTHLLNELADNGPEKEIIPPGNCG